MISDQGQGHRCITEDDWNRRPVVAVMAEEEEETSPMTVWEEMAIKTFMTATGKWIMTETVIPETVIGLVTETVIATAIVIGTTTATAIVRGAVTATENEVVTETATANGTAVIVTATATGIVPIVVETVIVIVTETATVIDVSGATVNAAIAIMVIVSSGVATDATIITDVTRIVTANCTWAEKLTATGIVADVTLTGHATVAGTWTWNEEVVVLAGRTMDRI